MHANPEFMTGDLVAARWARNENPQYTGIVISVQHANSVPDAIERGLANFGWSYWVFDGMHVLGPMTGSWLRKIR